MSKSRLLRVAISAFILPLLCLGQQIKQGIVQKSTYSEIYEREPSDLLVEGSTCNLIAVSPYFQFHTAGVSFASHPNGCGRCIKVECASDSCSPLAEPSVVAAIAYNCLDCDGDDIKLNSFSFTELFGSVPQINVTYNVNWTFTACDEYGFVIESRPVRGGIPPPELDLVPSPEVARAAEGAAAPVNEQQISTNMAIASEMPSPEEEVPAIMTEHPAVEAEYASNAPALEEEPLLIEQPWVNGVYTSGVRVSGVRKSGVRVSGVRVSGVR